MVRPLVAFRQSTQNNFAVNLQSTKQFLRKYPYLERVNSAAGPFRLYNNSMLTGLGLRGRKRSPGVVERVANALCGPAAPAAAPRVPRRRRPSPRPLVWSQFILEERFLEKFFLYFNANDRRSLAQVCTRWRDILYSSPRWWNGLIGFVDCRELRSTSGCCVQRFYNSLIRRGIRGVALVSGSDDDINEFIRQFPLSAHHLHAIGLKGCTVTDRGLEAILDHLQVCSTGIYLLIF